MRVEKNKLLTVAIGVCGATLGVIVPVHARTTDEFFRDGVARYESGDYAGAARAFEVVIASAPVGLVPAAAWYNVGNCRYRAGRYGWARYCYLQALRSRWYDGDVRHNLAFVEKKAGVFVQEDPLRWVFYFPSVEHLAIGVLACNVVCFGLLSLQLIAPRIPVRRAAMLAAVCLAGVGAWCAARYAAAARKVGVVTEETTISSAPDVTVGVKTAPLPEAERVEILSRKDDWYAVYVPRSRTQGWVRSSVVQELP